jgi:hypothetical protein
MSFEISKTRHPMDGFTLTAMVTGKGGTRFEKMRYIGYSDREARQEFRQHLRGRKVKPA